MREFLVNLGFDLGLRARVTRAEPSERAARVLEGPFAWLVGSSPSDTVRLPHPPPAEFSRATRALGLPMAGVTVAPAVRAHATPVPFGWDRETVALTSRYDAPPAPPDLEVVRRVNGREFAHLVSRELLGDDPGPGPARSVEEVERLLDAEADSDHGWVAKTEHGNAALGNRRLRSRRLSPGDRRWLGDAFADHDVVVLERWRPRVLDLCVVFEVAPDGSARGVAVHEAVHTAAGSFVGALFDPAGPAPARAAFSAAQAADPVAGALADAGYTGPACLDAFVWWRDGRWRLRPLSDLNARMHASSPGRELWRTWAPDRVVYWRLLARRRLTLPDDPEEAQAALGGDGLDPTRREGVVLVSPTAFGEPGSWRASRRMAVAFVARDRTAVFRLEARFRDRFER